MRREVEDRRPLDAAVIDIARDIGGTVVKAHPAVP
jgi:hypothetical protein